MRFAFIGADEVTLLTARLLGDKGHEVIIVEKDRDTINARSEEVDCSFLHGDGSHPKVLQELAPEQTDALFCATDDDKDNLVAGLVGKSLNFKRVYVSVSDPKLEEICKELNLDHTIVPKRMISRLLVDLAEGREAPDLSEAIRDQARLFTFKATKNDAGAPAELDLPKEARVVCAYRGEDLLIANEDMKIKTGDEVVILTHCKHHEELEERWPRKE